MESKYADLLKSRSVKRWFDNLGRGSDLTAGNYLRKLGSFCNSNQLTAAALANLKDRQLYHLLLDTVSSMENGGASGGYIAGVLKAVKSWLSFNGRPLKHHIKIRGAYQSPTLVNERVPSQRELRSILLAGDLKARTICVLMAHSGLRPQVLGNHRGSDGLRISDLPELIVERNEVKFTRIPTLVKVRDQLSKNRLEYFTFLGEEGCSYLKDYLEWRLRDSEHLTEQSAIIRPRIAKKAFITTVNIGDAARQALRKGGFSWRPYVLRSYFATQLMVAESKRFIIRDYRTFFMGHKGDVEAVYTVNKRRLPEDLVEQMRDSYTKCQKYLQTAEGGKEEDVTKEFKRQLLLVAGFKSDEIKEEHLDLEDEEFQKLVRDRLVTEVKINGARQKVVEINRVEDHLADGWEFVAALPDNRAILRLPKLARAA